MNKLPSSSACEHNKGPILAVLQDWLTADSRVLEIASGTGQHAEHFACQRPDWSWQPSDYMEASLPFIGVRCAGLANVAPPQLLDVLDEDWPPALGAFDALYCANMLHIAPWECCSALMRHAARRLRPGGALILYGPYKVAGEPLAAGNAAFDADLRSRDAAWGLRQLDAVQAEAARADLHFAERRDMPSNNLMLRWRLGISAA